MAHFSQPWLVQSAVQTAAPYAASTVETPNVSTVEKQKFAIRGWFKS